MQHAIPTQCRNSRAPVSSCQLCSSNRDQQQQPDDMRRMLVERCWIDEVASSASCRRQVREQSRLQRRHQSSLSYYTLTDVVVRNSATRLAHGLRHAESKWGLWYHSSSCCSSSSAVNPLAANGLTRVRREGLQLRKSKTCVGNSESLLQLLYRAPTKLLATCLVWLTLYTDQCLNLDSQARTHYTGDYDAFKNWGAGHLGRCSEPHKIRSMLVRSAALLSRSYLNTLYMHLFTRCAMQKVAEVLALIK